VSRTSSQDFLEKQMKDRPRTIAYVVLAISLAAAFFFAASFPAVEGLGTKVRLPVFHGAMTWVNLAAFALLGIMAIAYLITRKEGVYRWEEGLRWVAVPMWVIGSVLGLLAALKTWDFTGSKSSPMSLVMADPRLTAQFWILLAGLALLAFGVMTDDKWLLSILDLGFVAVAWVVLLRAILGPGRALHPDSPVMNSDEIMIKLLFLGIVASLSVATLAGAWLIARWRTHSASDATLAVG
jgi:hypothetical protein